MKTLYIGLNVEQIKTGADVVNVRNYEILSNYFGNEFNSYLIDIEAISKFDNLTGYLGGIGHLKLYEILTLIRKEKIELVFLSQSFYGRVARILKKNFPNLKIITFFHNVEAHYSKELLKFGGIKHFPFYFWSNFNEKLIKVYSDFNIVLNDRDAKQLQSFHKLKSDLVLPVSYDDKFDNSKVDITKNDIPNVLFVGTAFFANIQGISHFIENIFPFTKVNLTVVGKGMGILSDKYISDRIKIYDYAPSLSDFYYNCDAVVAPIYSGGGMKTKIAEALMYGKVLIGTPEAFEGYDTDVSSIYTCNTDESFVTTINNLHEKKLFDKFSNESRELFLKKYDSKVIKNSLINFIGAIKA